LRQMSGDLLGEQHVSCDGRLALCTSDSGLVAHGLCAFEHRRALRHM
jgi:hypothetical protein